MRYRVALLDPPWRYKTSLPGFARKHGDVWKRPGSVTPYSTMADQEIIDLPIADLLCADSHLYLWSTMTHLPVAFRCLDSWGFQFSTVLLWIKRPRGFAGFPTWNNCVEFLLFAKRGSWPSDRRYDRNWWILPRRKHSEKPPFFQDMIEQVATGPRVELFARTNRLGWKGMGWELSGLDIREELRIERLRNAA